MRKLACLFLAMACLLSACAVYEGHPRGGYGNGFCPPGQAKKGRC